MQSAKLAEDLGSNMNNLIKFGVNTSVHKVFIQKHSILNIYMQHFLINKLLQTDCIENWFNDLIPMLDYRKIILYSLSITNHLLYAPLKVILETYKEISSQ